MCVFSMVSVCGKKLFLSLLVLVLMDLYRLPEGSRSNRGRMGAVNDIGHSVEAA